MIDLKEALAPRALGFPFTHCKKQKPHCWGLYFLAESEGLLAFELHLRKLISHFVRDQLCAVRRKQCLLREPEGSHSLIAKNKSPIAGACIFWRRARDSNPRYRFKPVCFLSREVPSTTRPALRFDALIARA